MKYQTLHSSEAGTLLDMMSRQSEWRKEKDNPGINTSPFSFLLPPHILYLISIEHLLRNRSFSTFSTRFFVPTLFPRTILNRLLPPSDCCVPTAREKPPVTCQKSHPLGDPRLALAQFTSRLGTRTCQ